MRKSEKHDPLVAEIERELAPGQFIRYDEMSDFVDGLERVSKELSSLTDNDAEKAVRLYELFLSGCYEKAEEMEMAHHHWDKALTWVEKGMALEPVRNWRNECAYSLAQLKPKLLTKLGRKEDALSLAWVEFQKNPCDMAYKALMEHIPKGDRAEWHERAMQAAAQGALDDFVSLCVAAKDWERLTARIHTANHSELEAVSHYQSEPAGEDARAT